jgi:CHAT domain-containing protein
LAIRPTLRSTNIDGFDFNGTPLKAQKMNNNVQAGGGGLGGAEFIRATRKIEWLDHSGLIWQFLNMRCVQTIQLLFVTVWLGLVCCPGLQAQSVTTNTSRTTFEYKESRNYPDLTNSIQETERRLADTERKLGTDNTNFAYQLVELAGNYDDLGDYARAASLDERAIAILEPLLGTNNEKMSDAVNDLAWECREMNDYERALPLFQRSLTMDERLFGSDNYRIATTLTGMADIYREQGDYARALPLCLKGFEIRKKVLGPDHPDITDSLYTLAAIYRELGNFKEALSTCQRSIVIGERQLGPEHPMVAENVFLMGQIQSDLGNFAEASTAFHRALTFNVKISGPDHPDVVDCLRQLALLSGKQHDLNGCIAKYVELFKRQRRYFVGQILASSDRNALRLFQNSFASTESFHSACAEGSAENLENARIAGATELALNKALLEEVRAAQAAAEADPQTATGEIREQFRSTQYELDHLGQTGLTGKQLEARRHELQEDLSRIETKLSDRVGLVAQAIRERSLTLTGIAHSLPLQSVLVDFIQYRRYDFTARTNQWKEQHYGAYLTFPLAENATNVVVERVDLGEAAAINDDIAIVCRRMSAGQYAAPDLSAALQRLHGSVYAPLACYLTNTSHLIICPDGQLSRVPFEILPVGNRFLLEEKTVSYVTSGREIVRLAKPKKHAGLSRSVVMGNPDFDRDLASPHRSVSDVRLAAAPMALSSLTRHFDGLKFQPLPGAEAEARSVASLLGKDAVLYLGADAGVAELKSVKSPRVLHLATHGFYFPDQEINLLRRLSAGKGNNNWENPLIRCGLAMAGANHALQITNTQADNGLVTGLEASLLDLQGTELVILSACDSGTGEEKIGEGVMSLRRAFLIAGAQTVLASYWDISDKATRQLMTEFMRRWQNGEPRAAAWRNAQLSLLHSSDFSNPYFWAAFTLTGQWQ